MKPPRFRPGGHYRTHMIQWRRFGIVRATLPAVLGMALLMSFTSAADARGGHATAGGHGGHRGQFTSDRRGGNDAYGKAASDEADKLLNSRLKSICRGC